MLSMANEEVPPLPLKLYKLKGGSEQNIFYTSINNEEKSHKGHAADRGMKVNVKNGTCIENNLENLTLRSSTHSLIPHDKSHDHPFYTPGNSSLNSSTLSKSSLSASIEDLISKNFSEFETKSNDEDVKQPCVLKFQSSAPSTGITTTMNFKSKAETETVLKCTTLPTSFSAEYSSKRRGSKCFIKDDPKSELFGSLFNKVVETDEDIMAFSSAITGLRNSLGWSYKSNSGIMNPPIDKNYILTHTAVNVLIYFDNLSDEKVIQCEYSWTSNEIIAKYVTTFQDGLSSLDLFSNDYILKIIGFDLYLDGNVCLSDYVHIQEYSKHGETIKLALISRESVNNELACESNDDILLNTSNINFEDYFEKDDSLSVSEQGLNVLLESYDKEVDLLMRHVSENVEPNFKPDRLIQVVKAISTVLATLDFPQIQDAIQLLRSLRTSKSIHSNLITTDSIVNLDTNQDELTTTFDEQIFDLALEDLTQGIYYLIELYCKSFGFKFDIEESKKTIPKAYTEDIYERVDPCTISDKFSLYLESVHRIPSEWKTNFCDFYLEVGLYYGGKLLCAIERSTASSVKKGFFEHISFAQLVEFDIPVRQIPRETKIGFVLNGIITSKSHESNKTSLCWFTANLYDYQGFLVSGSRLFGMLHDVEFDSATTCATNYIHHCDTVIIKVDFQTYPIEVMFPEPIVFIADDSLVENRLQNLDMDRTYGILRKDAMHLCDEEKSFIWNNRFSFSSSPRALIYIISSVPSWDAESLSLVHNTLNVWKKLQPHNALKLLEGSFPDKMIREKAINWMSELTNHEFLEYLPALVQALKYEAYHNSVLAQYLIKRSLSCPRITNYLYWYLKYYVQDSQFCQRYKTLLSGLLHVSINRLRKELSQQDSLIKELTRIATDVKECKSSLRQSILENELDKLNEKLNFPLRMPFDPSIKVRKIVAKDSSYFNSNATPLKIAFQNDDPLGKDVHTIFKIGDDLRKDLLILHMLRIMNSLWLKNGLDLKIMLYNVLPTGPYTGLIEIVPNAVTLREIHIQYGGVTGSFKYESLSLWLQQFNSTEKQYEHAVDNFTASVAGYCVATYILGIGDRHNDNIMMTKNGNLFHIDFNKFMGDMQKFGKIKRDRVPFILTQDMAYVINNGTSPSQNFQKFIEYCCAAFNIIRQHRNKLLNVLSLMMYSDIAYLSPKEDIEYVYHSLQLQLSDEEAAVYFSQLIRNTLSSKSTQLNFFIHNVAHRKDSSDPDSKKTTQGSLFTFSNKRHKFNSNNGVQSARVVDFQKRYVPSKYYVFVINIVQKDKVDPDFVFRRYEDFQELHANLLDSFGLYSGVELPELPPKLIIGRSQIREVAQQRRFTLDRYLVELSKLPAVWSSSIMATFLHSYIRDHDEKKMFYDSIDFLLGGWKSRIGGKIKLSMVYEKRLFKVFVVHVSGLVPRRIQGLADSYVKAYLLPDFMKHTKRKTKICKKSLNPTFNETFTYNYPAELLRNRILQITVWDQCSMTDKDFLGGINYYLSSFDPKKSTSGWFTLADIDLDT